MTTCLERLTFAAQHAQFQIRRRIGAGGNAHVGFACRIIHNTAVSGGLVDCNSKSGTRYR